MNKQELNRFIDKISPTGPGGIEKIKRVLKTVLDKEGEEGVTEEELLEALTTKQDTLVSGTNLKTVNNTSLLGSGNIAIPKGDKGDKGDTGPQGPQGPQGNTGSSVDYPFELANNLTTDDATKALAAAQGKVLDWKVDQLGQETQESGYFVVDSDNSIAMKYDEDGFDAAKISEHFLGLLPKSPLSGTSEEGFYIVDSLKKIAIKYDQYGFDVAKLSNHFLSLLPTSSATVVATDPLVEKWSTMLRRCCKYLLGTYLQNASFAGTGPIASFGGTDEAHLRHPAAAAFALSAAVYLDVYDEVVAGYTQEYALNQAYRIVIGLANKHSINNSGSEAWGSTWQSPLFAMLMGMAYYCDAERYTESEVGLIQNAIVAECSYVLSLMNTPAKMYWKNASGTVLNAGDTKAEEVAWYNSVLILAKVAFGSSSYDEAIIKLGVIASAKPSDLTSGKSINGFSFSELGGWNMEENGIMYNHNRIHPDYMTYNLTALAPISLSFYNKIYLPAAIFHNVNTVCHALCTLDFPTSSGYDSPGGTIYIPASQKIYYPQGDDWGGNLLYEGKALWDSCAWAFGWCPENDFSRWANLHLDRALWMQDRFTDGRIYADNTENSYLGKEQQAAQIAATALLALKAKRNCIYY